ncbi:magnesium and cobalt transport protein CorA [Promicromonospora sp. NPDC050880]|uniref:magnesium and cobalt transport protein CorA n=1 Tax=Promicromonospora sp. NPDC050880 TaxID=3364406 RepID=UPI0037912960
MTIMDNAVYVDGRRTANPASIEETYEITRARGGIAWVDLAWPTAEEIQQVAAEFALHHLAVEDAIAVHQRPKIERFDDALFVVLHPALDPDGSGDGRIGRVEFGTVHAWVGPDFVVTIRRSAVPDLATMRERLESRPNLLRHGPRAILATLLEQVVDTYRPVVTRLRTDIDQVEDRLFSRDPEVSRGIYEATREVIGLQRATLPLVDVLRALRDDAPPAERGPGYVELERHLRSVLDHAVKYAETADTYRSLLANVLGAHSTLVTQEQNEQMKQISAWAAILFAPSLVGTVYGMNFRHMPELHWTFGYPLALLVMVVLGAVLYRVFKRVGWL